MKTIFFLLAFAIQAHALTLNWNVNIDPITGQPDLTTAGYNVYIGTATGKEVLAKKLGLVFTYTVPPQASGTYFAYVAAYNIFGYQGLISNEVEWSYNTPTPLARVLTVSAVDPTPTPSPTVTPKPTPTP
jgi:hypothetical protein